MCKWRRAKLLARVKRSSIKLFQISVHIVVNIQSKVYSSRFRLINLKNAVRKINNIFEFVLPDRMVHLLELSEVIFNDAFFIFFV